MIPTWLQHHLEARGLWDIDGVTRAARARRCRTCRKYVLAGLDSDRCALPVAVDPDPLSALGEAAALIAGRATYALRFWSGRLELDHRNQYEIRAGGDRRRDVLADHLCGQPSIGAAPALGMVSRLAPPPTASPAAEPPF